MQSNHAERVRRMWAEVADEPLSNAEATALAEGLEAEVVPQPNATHRRRVLAAVLESAAVRREGGVHVAVQGPAAGRWEAERASDRRAGGANSALAASGGSCGPAVERAFRVQLDQGVRSVGTWRLFDAVRPHILLLSWSYWATAVLLFALGAFALPRVQGWGAGALIATVPLLGLISLLYTLRSGNHRMREWEQSCPVTPFQIALARLILVLGITLSAALIGSLVLVRQEIGPSLAALTISWLAPLLLIVGAYLIGDMAMGGFAGPAGGASVWIVHLILTQGGRVATSAAVSQEGLVLSYFDVACFLIGLVLLAVGLLLSTRRGEAADEHHAA